MNELYIYTKFITQNGSFMNENHAALKNEMQALSMYLFKNELECLEKKD